MSLSRRQARQITDSAYLAAATALLAIAFAHRRGIDRALGVPASYALAQPVGVLATVAMMAASQFRVRSGRGVTWKGRRYAG